MTSQVIEGGAPSRGRAFLASFIKNILPAVPLLLIVGFFFLFPIARLIYVSFLSNENTFTIDNFKTAVQEPYRTGFLNSIKIGVFSAAMTKKKVLVPSLLDFKVPSTAKVVGPATIADVLTAREQIISSWASL